MNGAILTKEGRETILKALLDAEMILDDNTLEAKFKILQAESNRVQAHIKVIDEMSALADVALEGASLLEEWQEHHLEKGFTEQFLPKVNDFMERAKNDQPKGKE